MTFAGCWSCGAHGPCLAECDCAKCVDPIDYAEWKAEEPEAYADWIESQRLDHDEICECPSCVL